MRLFYRDDRAQIWNGDARDLHVVDDESVGLVLTSPPWWDGGDYRHPDQIGFGQTREDFLDALRRAAEECLRCLMPGCAMILWMADIRRKEVPAPLAADTHRPLQQAGFVYEATYYWHSRAAIPPPSPEVCVPMTIRSNHYPGVLIAYRKPGTLVPPPPEIVEASRIDPEEYRESLQSIWTPDPLNDSPYGRLIRLWSYVDDIVLDPFAGEGSVPILAGKLGRRSISVELNESTCVRLTELVRRAQAPA